MATNRDVALNIIADIRKYQGELGKIPGITEKQAAKAALRMQRELAKGQKAAAKQAKKAAESSAQAWQTAGTVIGASLSVDAIKAAGSALLGFVDSVVSSVDEIETFAKRTGLTNKEIAGLQLAAASTGKTLQDLLPPDLAKRMLETAQGTGEALKGFKALKVSTVDLNTGALRPTGAVLRDLIDKLAAVEDPALRAALATQTLGKKGGMLLSTLSSSAALDAFVETAAAFGTDVGPDAVRSAGLWQAATAELQLAFKGAGDEFLAGVGGPGRISDFVRDFTLGFTAVGKFIGVFTREALGGMSAQFKAIGALLRGDFAEAQEQFSKGFDPRNFFTALVTARTEALATAKSMVLLRNKVAATAKEIEGQEGTIEDLVKAEAKATKASREFAKAQARAAGETIKLTKKLADIGRKAGADQLSAEGKLLAARRLQADQIAEIKARLKELGDLGVDVSRAQVAAEVAATQASARARRDLDGLKDFQHQKELDRIDEIVEAGLEAEERVRDARDQALDEEAERWSKTIGFIVEFGDIAFGTLAELQHRQTRAAVDALNDARGAIRAIKAERAELTEQLLAEEDVIEQARIQARLNELEAELVTSKAARKDQRQSALKSFAASQQLALAGVGFNTAMAILQAFAMFGPPPSPIGVTSAAIAVATGATQAALIATEKPPQFHTGRAGPVASFTQAGEILASLSPSEAVLTGRAADNFGRDRIEQANATGNAGGGPVFVLDFERRHVDTMVARTLQGGGMARMVINRITRSRAAGQLAIVGE